jgi:aminoglycoside 6'-N-acetyltransferase
MNTAALPARRAARTTRSARRSVSLRPFDAAHDLALLSTWLAEPHVHRYWGDPQRNLLDARRRGADSSHAIVTADGAAVGYACWAVLAAQDLADVGVSVPDDATVDIDLLIGNAASLGQGIGTEALLQLLTRLAADTTLERACVFTSCENLVAQRAFEKAGFDRIARYPDPEFGMSWVMIAPLRRAAS